MMMMPPTTISLPIKILFFILIDGWNLLIGNLVRSFNWGSRSRALSVDELHALAAWASQNIIQ